VLIGGEGSDRPVDGGNSGRVHGGMGRDLVIGGLGDDVLEGMVHEDILIGSRTIHDNNNDALRAIIAEWGYGTASDAWIDERIDNLTNGGGLNGEVKLDAASVLDDFTHDYLWGSYSRDWFIAFPDDELAPHEPLPGDRVTYL
jgi:hypothetical protein